MSSSVSEGTSAKPFGAGAPDNPQRFGKGYCAQEGIGHSWLWKRQSQLKPAQPIRLHPNFLLPRFPSILCARGDDPFHLLHFTEQLFRLGSQDKLDPALFDRSTAVAKSPWGKETILETNKSPTAFRRPMTPNG